MTLKLLVAALLLTSPSTTTAADFQFCWVGANGYRFDGTMSVPDAALKAPVVTENDVTAFSITGSRDGTDLGTWSLDDLTPSTSWNLNFDPATLEFVTGGHSSSSRGQEWNANGRVNNCSTGGFGFNSGSIGQDVCIDNTIQRDSSIDEFTRFPVARLGETPFCAGEMLIGGLLPPSPNS